MKVLSQLGCVDISSDLCFSSDPASLGVRDPDSFSLKRLSQGVLLSDSCAQAQKMQRLISQRIEDEVVQSLPPGVCWEALDHDSRLSYCNTLRAGCENHHRNSAIRRAVGGLLDLMESSLSQSLAQFPRNQRIGVDPKDIVRTIAKDFVFGRSNMYAKVIVVVLLVLSLTSHCAGEWCKLPCMDDSHTSKRSCLYHRTSRLGRTARHRDGSGRSRLHEPFILC